jgi:hypothetical protein
MHRLKAPESHFEHHNINSSNSSRQYFPPSPTPDFLPQSWAKAKAALKWRPGEAGVEAQPTKLQLSEAGGVALAHAAPDPTTVRA